MQSIRECQRGCLGAELLGAWLLLMTGCQAGPGALDLAQTRSGGGDKGILALTGTGKPAPGQGQAAKGLGPWSGRDNVPPSADPPMGLAPGEVPLFVTIGFDDNAYSGLAGSAGTGGMKWATDMLKDRKNQDGSPARVSFNLTSIYAGTWMSESPTFVKLAWHQALLDGHELANHTHSHPHGDGYTVQQWVEEIDTASSWLTKPFDPKEEKFSPDATKGVGAAKGSIVGFRTPYLEYNDATFAAARSLGFWYDCSIEDGFQEDQDGTNFFWPYTLDQGSPGHDVLVEWGLKKPIQGHPGLWELPANPVIVPPDGECAQYGVPSGLRKRMKGYQDWFDVESGKITGLDYNMWVQFRMTKAEFLATLKYTLDLRLQGNRAPFMFGAHTDYYSSKYPAVQNATLEARQEAIAEFLDYALSKKVVRVVPMTQILEWVRNPAPLN